MVTVNEIKKNIKANKSPINIKTGTLAFKVSEFVLGQPGTVYSSKEVSFAMKPSLAPSVRAAVQSLALNFRKSGINRIKYAGVFVYGSITDIKVIENAYKVKKATQTQKEGKKVEGALKVNKESPKVIETKKETDK